MKKYFVLFLVLALSAAMLTGCDSGSDKYTSKELMEKVSGAVTDMGDTKTVEKDDPNGEKIFKYLSDMDIDDVEDFAYTYSGEGNPEEIAIIRLKSEDDVKGLESDLLKRIDSRRATFMTYDEKQVEKFKAAQVVYHGKYVMLIIGKQSQNGIYEFDKAFEAEE